MTGSRSASETLKMPYVSMHPIVGASEVTAHPVQLCPSPDLDNVAGGGTSDPKHAVGVIFRGGASPYSDRPSGRIPRFPCCYWATMRQDQGVTVLAQLPLQDTTVALRRATAEDVPSIVNLLAADQLGATRDGVATVEDLQPYLNAFGVIDADPAHLLLVATDGAQVLATMQLSFLPGLARRGALRAQIEAVRVRHDYRGRGLGAALFEWSIEESRRRNCALVQLTTDKSRADAHRFYERLGFVASHEGLKLTLLH